MVASDPVGWFPPTSLLSLPPSRCFWQGIEDPYAQVPCPVSDGLRTLPCL